MQCRAQNITRATSPATIDAPLQATPLLPLIDTRHAIRQDGHAASARLLLMLSSLLLAAAAFCFAATNTGHAARYTLEKRC